jgi:hypothetical protein
MLITFARLKLTLVHSALLVVLNLFSLASSLQTTGVKGH